VSAQASTGYLSDPPRRPALTHGAEAEALLEEVRGALATLTGLLVYERDLDGEVTSSIRNSVEEVEERLRRRQVRVAMVGESGSGKSTLVDALLGERLLGTTRTEPSLVVTVERAPRRAYRVRLKNGACEDFATRSPDPTPKLAESLAAAEAAALAAQKRSGEAVVEFVAATDAVESAEADLNAAFRAFEESRAQADRLGGELARAEQDHETLAAETERSLAALPVVLQRLPPWWAVWLWLVRLLVLVTSMRSYRDHRRLRRKRDRAESDVSTRRLETSRAADFCKTAEAELAAANAPVEAARKALAATRRIRAGTDARREERDQEVQRRRDELSRAEKARAERFAQEIRALTDPAAHGSEVDELEIEFPARLLPEDVVIIDVPGAMSERADLSERAWQIVRERADGCIVVSQLEHAVNSRAQKFMEQVREAVPHAILVLTMLDESYDFARKKGGGDPRDEVDRARKIGTRRFAREVGRDPNAVLSVAVSAEEALRSGESSADARRDFETQIEAAFTVVRQERALILGARSAGIVRNCIARATEAEARAEQSYQERIAALEAQRIPGPEIFHAEQMQAAEPDIAQGAKGVVDAAKKAIADQGRLIRVECEQLVLGCKNKEDLRALPPRLSDAIRHGAASARQAALAELEKQTEATRRRLEAALLGVLRERYQLLHAVEASPAAPPNIDARFDGVVPSPDLARAIENAVRSFHRMRVGFGAGGAIAGGTAGTLVFPGIGTVAGALAGGLMSFARTFKSLQRATVAAIDGAIGEVERALEQEIQDAEPAVAAAIRDGLGKSLAQALSRFIRWIAEPIQAEREAIDRERENLRDLELIRLRLAQHEARLAWLIEAASVASVGLHA
jgi:hypothetical protein